MRFLRLLPVLALFALVFLALPAAAEEEGPYLEPFFGLAYGGDEDVHVETVAGGVVTGEDLKNDVDSYVTRLGLRAAIPLWNDRIDLRPRASIGWKDETRNFPTGVGYGQKRELSQTLYEVELGVRYWFGDRGKEK